MRLDPSSIKVPGSGAERSKLPVTPMLARPVPPVNVFGARAMPLMVNRSPFGILFARYVLDSGGYGPAAFRLDRPT